MKNKKTSIIFIGIILIFWWVLLLIMASRSIIKPVTEVRAFEAPTTIIPKEQARWYRLYKLVRKYESNDGTKDLAVTCAKKGKINEIGYLPYKGYCFSIREEQELTFAVWMNRLNTMTESQALCLWNTGKLLNTCAYSEGRLSEAN